MMYSFFINGGLTLLSGLLSCFGLYKKENHPDYMKFKQFKKDIVKYRNDLRQNEKNDIEKIKRKNKYQMRNDKRQ